MNPRPAAHARSKALHERHRAVHAAPPTPKALHAAGPPRRLWRFPVALSVVLIVLLAVGGAAYGYLAATGSGSGTATPATISPLKVTASTTPTATLLPGHKGTLYFTVHNPNHHQVTLTKLTTIKPTTSTAPLACAASNLKRAVLLPQAVSITVTATGTLPTSLSTMVDLTSIAPTACQGVTFTVTLVFTGKTS